MWNDDELNRAIDEFLSKLPPRMIELAQEAITLEYLLEQTQDEATRTEIQNELELVNREFFQSANENHRQKMN